MYWFDLLFFVKFAIFPSFQVRSLILTPLLRAQKVFVQIKFFEISFVKLFGGESKKTMQCCTSEL